MTDRRGCGLHEREVPLTVDDSQRRSRNRRLALGAAVLVIAAVRVWYCTRVPVNTADLLRSIHQSLYMLRDGLGVAGVPLADLDEGLECCTGRPLPRSGGCPVKGSSSR